MPDVYVFQGGEPARMAYEAAERIFDEDASALSVLLKVNTGFKGPAASGLYPIVTEYSIADKLGYAV